MAIRFNCGNPACGREIAAPESVAGKKVRCPDCGKVQKVPAAPAPEGPSSFSAEGAPAPERPVRPFPRPKKKTYARESRDIGRYVKIILLLGFGVGVIVGAALLITWMASKPVEYMKTVTDSRKVGERVKIQSNLRNIHKVVQTLAITEDRFPVSVEELIRKGGLSWEFFESAGNPDEKLEYIPGQSNRSDPSNILVYDPNPGPDGRHVVLRVGGRIEYLAPDQLDAAVAKTKEHLR